MGMLDGKVAIVTGAGNGVGRGEAILLADHGAKAGDQIEDAGGHRDFLRVGEDGVVDSLPSRRDGNARDRSRDVHLRG